ncbi:MAG TPA: hypothetical protein VFG25_07245 [Nitrosopumilaceae archaeon]|nr:hypothetical protein [Nitrosopumilaceae archaeon]
MKSIYESLIVFAVFTGVLLPVRLLFVTYVSDNWFGSFGIISAISIGLIVLTKKEKLGEFGRMFDRQMNKFMKGKRGKFFFAEATIFLFILGGMIFAVEQGNSTYVNMKNQLLDEHPEFTDADQILEKSEELEFRDYLFGFVVMVASFFVAFPIFSAVFAVINDATSGWLLHFYTVAFVEYIELFGILVLYKFSFKRMRHNISESKN